MVLYNLKKHILFIVNLMFLGILMTSCNDYNNKNVINIPIEIPNLTIEKSSLEYNNSNSTWLLNGQPYSGIAVSYYSNGILKEEITIFNGKKENETKQWYSNGNRKLTADFHEGKLNGEKKFWSSESVLLSHLSYKLGKPHGEQKTWYPTGELHKVLNLEEGKEEGLQKAYRKNGVLYANYEVKKGRIFGLKKAMLCFGLDEETIQYEN